jgi:DNA-binding MarR family transcriptional regulator
MADKSPKYGPDGGATAQLVADLRVLVGKLVRRVREEVSPGELSFPQASALGRIDRDGPTTVTALARAEGIKPQSMGATVAVLEAAGFVAGTPHPTDGRQTILTITEAGHRWMLDRRAAREDWLARTLNAKLSAAEQADVAKAVALLARIVDPPTT